MQRLTASIDGKRFSSRIVCLTPLGPLGRELQADRRITVESLDCASIFDVPQTLYRLTKLVRSFKPDIIQTWLYHADFLGTFASIFYPKSVLVWNIRNSDLSPENRLSWRVLTSVLARLSRLPDGIVSNSVAGVDAHMRYGYTPEQWAHIPNGWSVADETPTAKLRSEQRHLLGLPKNSVLIGWVGRLAKQKDIGCFLTAVSLLHNRLPHLKFVLIGKNLKLDTVKLREALRNTDVRNRLIFLGEQSDVPSLLPALDAVTLTSAYGEGSPNSIGEAMAAGLPVITTDVGDARRLTPNGNWIVPPRSPEALAEAWIALARLAPEDRARLGDENRTWIDNNYSLRLMDRRYEDLYTMLMRPRTKVAVPDSADESESRVLIR